MKKLLLTLGIVLAHYCSYAQWTNTGSNIHPVTLSDNVGIGTTSPNAKLHIESNDANGVQTLLRNAAGTSANPNMTLIQAGPSAYGIAGWTNSSILESGDVGNLVLSSYYGNILFQNNARTNRMIIDASGNVGIGTISPTEKLQVAGQTLLSHFGYLSGTRTLANSYTSLFLGGALKDNENGTYTAITDGGSNYFGAIKMDNTGGNAGAINFYTGPSTGNTNYNISNLENYARMSIVGDKVGIGTASPDAKLAVNGTIHSTEVKVDAIVPTPDYVFEPDYKLTSLEEIKSYVDKNHHLPNIPSAKEIEKNGIQLGGMSMNLLKTIEELSLHVIELNNQLKAQNEKINNLEKELHNQPK